jgi:osmotically-inducible protein OsmY
MRRFFMGMAIASLTAGAPLTAFGGDREIADAIVSTLKKKQTDGSLKGFDIDLSVEDGKVVVGGTVATKAQLDSVLQVASTMAGVKLVENKASVREQSPSFETVARKSGEVMPASANESFDNNSGSEPSKLGNTAEPVVSPIDARITTEILGRLGSAQRNGHLRNFELDVSTVDKEVWARGVVATPEQKQLVLGTAQNTPGVVKVIDDITVAGRVRQASGQVPSPSSMPVVGSGAPRAFAPSSLTNGPMNGPMPAMGGPAAPVPMQGGAGYGGGTPRYDQPNMPSYAWPSYAAYPNYSAVTYPKQYSASAWPYIGPFYPYPQVPLGWRKVALEWDDGLWYLDFTSK